MAWDLSGPYLFTALLKVSYQLFHRGPNTIPAAKITKRRKKGRKEVRKEGRKEGRSAMLHPYLYLGLLSRSLPKLKAIYLIVMNCDYVLYRKAMAILINQSINQSINQLINQSINQLYLCSNFQSSM